MSLMTMPRAIRSSEDLALILNAPPATEADAAETPRDWLAGIWVAGTVYPLDPDATTDTLAVLANGTAAVAYSPHGTYCGGEHGPASSHVAYSGHWCPADTDSWSDGEVRGVQRDWRSVSVWDANGYSDTTVYPSVEAARVAFGQERTEIEQMAREYDAQS
ncbi:hypothetical protein [Micromonospora chalcea]|uniref:hypothetical protein n=1 Tax=Micromonospora chalcea TaxID=1874 RepID=UPI003D74063C